MRLYGNRQTPPRVRNGRHIIGMGVNPCEDGRTLMKVSTVIHQNVPHNGGVNAVKREGVSTFDSNRDVILSNKVHGINEEKGQKANVGGRGR